MSYQTIQQPQAKCLHPGCNLTVTGQLNRETGQIVCPVGHPVQKIVTIGDLYNLVRQTNPHYQGNVQLIQRRMCDSCGSTLNKGDVFYECQDCGAPGFDICQKCTDNQSARPLVEGHLEHTILHQTIKRIHGQDGH